MEYQANNDPLIKAGASLPKPVVKIAEKLLKEGKTCEETAKIVSVRKQTIVNIRKEMEGEGKLELGAWKKEVAGLLGDFVQRGAVRLAQNVDSIPIGQLPMAIAIAIDKVRDLADAPTVRVEARLRISQDELNKAFSGGELPIEINEVKKEEKVLDQTEIQGTTDADENTQK
jgi:DNA-binding XRE family transcriptional regulator